MPPLPHPADRVPLLQLLTSPTLTEFEAAALGEPRDRRFVVVVVAVVLVLHLGTTIILRAVLGARGEEQSRLTDVRKFPVDGRLALVEDYLLRQWALTDKPKLVVLGDSQMRSHRVHASRTWSLDLARRLPEIQVVNLAITDGRVADSRKIVGLLEKHGLRPKWLIQNINIAHFNRYEEEGKSHLDSASSLPVALSVWRTAFSVSLDDAQEFIRGDFLLSRRSPRPDAAFRFVDLKVDSYRISKPERFRAAIEDLGAAAGRVCDGTYAFLAPVEWGAFEHYGFDVDGSRRDGAIIEDVYRAAGFDVFSVDAPPLPRDAFLDIVHLNGLGGVELARRIAAVIAPTTHDRSLLPLQPSGS